MAFHLKVLLTVSILFAFLCNLGHAQSGQSSPYAPTFVKCPSNLTVRAASGGLNPEEKAWRSKRLSQVVNSLQSYLQTANISDFNVTAYLAKVNASNAPVAGLAISGGGSQSGMGGLGIWQAFDKRYAAAVKAGTGGLVQCLTYLTGLSGGGFNTVLPLASSNFSSLVDVRAEVDLTSNYALGPSGNPNAFFKKLFEYMGTKAEEGFPVSVTDVFGQWFRQYLPAAWAFKDVSDFAGPTEAFSKGLAPMPIVLYADVIPGESPSVHKILYPGNTSTVYEHTPFEFGNWFGGRAQAFFPSKYLGTSMNAGKPAKASKCVTGFDKVTFAQGTTGGAWNFWFIDDFYGIPLFQKRDFPVPKSQQNSTLYSIVAEVAKIFKQSNTASLWGTYPNPFENYNKNMTGAKELLLVDGSETGETVPIRPLIVPERKLDFIVAFDSNGEQPEVGWPNGTTFEQSYIHAKQLGLSFPEVPDAATFINLGLNKFPTFFGCNASSSTPLVLYLPQSPWSAYTNYSYTTAQFTNNQLDLVFENSLNIASYGQGKYDKGKGFGACVACGLIYKSLVRTGQAVPAACQTCFKSYCWNGTDDNSPSKPAYDPELILDPGISYQKWNKTVWK